MPKNVAAARTFLDEWGGYYNHLPALKAVVQRRMISPADITLSLLGWIARSKNLDTIPQAGRGGMINGRMTKEVKDHVAGGEFKDLAGLVPADNRGAGDTSKRVKATFLYDEVRTACVQRAQSVRKACVKRAGVTALGRGTRRTKGPLARGSVCCGRGCARARGAHIAEAAVRHSPSPDMLLHCTARPACLPTCLPACLPTCLPACLHASRPCAVLRTYRYAHGLVGSSHYTICAMYVRSAVRTSTT